MIYWVNTHRHQYTIERHLASFGGMLAGQVTPLAYEDVVRQTQPPPGVYLFGDVERLDERMLGRATAVCDQLRAAGSAVLNRPTDCLRRYDLLRMLHERGVNAFNVYRVRDEQAPRRYPVFLRIENDHKGNRSPLLKDAATLEKAVAEQCRTRVWFRDEHGKRRVVRWGARRRRELLVTEFCDTADLLGIYRKYAAFCVGGQIVARHLFFSQRWMLKSPERLAACHLAEELDYVEHNPHAAALAEICRSAKIEYGRIDYSLLDGRIQVWEINTNPMICSPLDEEHESRLPVHRVFAEKFASALRSLRIGNAADSRRIAA